MGTRKYGGHKYGALEEAKNEAEISSKATSRGISIFALVAVSAALAAIGFVVLGAGLWQYKKEEGSTSGVKNLCGNSSAEAIKQGCVFDQLMWAWFPPSCPHYTNDLYLQSEPDRPWKFFVDPYTREAANESEWAQAMDNKIELYGEKGEHRAHCVFMFLALAQIVRDSGRHVQKHTDYEHLEHCSKLLMELIIDDEEKFEVETSTGHVSYDQAC